VCASCKCTVDGTFIELAVADTGPGVSPQVATRMFEPFFSTKAPGKGSGMGLAMVHGIVHDHGGHVMLDAAPGGGALFRVLLPAVDDGLPHTPAPVRKHAVAARKAQPAGLRGQVLLVDDEESVLGFMRELLESWGLKVRATKSPLEAQIWLQRKRWHCDLLLTDHTMPGLTGLELARGLAGTGREVPVVLYSGHAEGIDEAEARQAGVRLVLHKPVEPEELREALRSCLQPAAGVARLEAAGLSAR
jgi:CheY-like chemotaxis protein